LRPGTQEEAAALLRGHDGPVRPQGGGTKPWGPLSEGAVLETGGLARVVAHNVGDFTAVLEAGVRLAEAQAAFAAEGQMLALDPPEDPRATVGGAMATNDSGPLRHRYGSLRDLVVGTTVVLSDGTIASSGGRVIKNVAGYDLGKLFCGSRGAFGWIQRAALRLHPRPAAQATVVVRFDTPQEGAGLAQAVLRSQLVPSALDILASRAPGRHPGGAREARGRCCLLFEGSERAVRAQVETALALVGGEEDASVWDEIAARQLAAGGRVPFDRLDAFLAATRDAVVRVSALNAYVPEPVPYEPSPLVGRIRAELAS